MRLPWWPIYIDARFDERGVYYTLGDEPEQLAFWHQVRLNINQGLNSIIEDAQGAPMRSGQALLLFRVNRKGDFETADKAGALQKAYFENPENQYTCRVSWKGQGLAPVFMLVYSMGLPIVFLVMMGRGYNSVPDNDPGARVQNVILIGMGTLLFFAFAASWRVCKMNWGQGKLRRVIEVDRFGVVTDESDYSWDSIDGIDPQFLGFVLTTSSGQRLLLPISCSATRLVQQQVCSPGPVGMKSFLFCLGIGLISGPIVWGWFRYLVPDEEFVFGVWGVSLVMTSGVLLIFGMVYFLIWKEKRSKSKSQ